MTTTATTPAIVLFDPVFADPRRLALGGFLAGYSGLTRDAYELDPRQFVAWCDDHQLDVFEVRRADIKAFARERERRGRARATVARRLCTVTSFYRYADEERLLAHSPAPASRYRDARSATGGRGRSTAWTIDGVDAPLAEVVESMTREARDGSLRSGGRTGRASGL
jgi:integrase